MLAVDLILHPHLMLMVLTCRGDMARMHVNNDRPVIRSPADIGALDKRCRPYRRYTAIRSAVLADLGGEQNTSEITRQLISKFATLALQLEELEAAALEGASIDLDLFGRCSGHMRRIGELLGLKRLPVEINPTADDDRLRIERLWAEESAS